MSNPKGRTIPDTMSMYIVILVLYCLDIFFLKTDQSVLGDALVSRIAGLGAIFGYIWATKDSVTLVGLSKKKEKIKTGLIFGAAFSLVPIAAVMFLEAIFYGITDISALNLKFQTPNQGFIYNIENLTLGTAIIIYFFSTFIGCFMKEIVFRGYILKKLKKVLNFNTANILQALLYMFMTIPWLLRNLLTGLYDKTTTSLGLFIICFYIIHETIAGIKWGLLTRVTGSTYVAIVEHFLFVFISNSLFITDRYVTWSFMAHNLAIQVTSFVLVLFYYKVNIKKLEEKENEENDAKKKVHSEKKAIDEKIKEINEISPEQFKTIVDKTNAERKTHHHRSSSGVQKQNERHSAANEKLIETVPTADAAKTANEYLENRMSQSHHHHSHRNSAADAANKDKLESYSADDAASKAEAYSDSLRLERKTPKHPHPHDTIARDSKLSAEELDKANADKVESLDETNIDDFLKNFNEDMSKSSHRHHHHHTEETETDGSENSGSFDADEFLKNYSMNAGSGSSHHSHGSEHSHHHHHHSHSEKQDKETVPMTEVSTDESFDEQRKTVEEKETKRKKKFVDKMRELGKIDDSDSNDLL